jgi:hypothetical protein
VVRWECEAGRSGYGEGGSRRRPGWRSMQRAKRRGRRVRSDAATPEGARVVVTEDAHRYTPVHVPPAAERGGCGQAGSGRGDRCGSSSRAVAAAAGRRLRAPVAVTSIAPYRRGGCIGGRRGKGTRHPMPGLCAGPLSLPGLGDRGGGHWHHDRRNWAALAWTLARGLGKPRLSMRVINQALAHTLSD